MNAPRAGTGILFGLVAATVVAVVGPQGEPCRSRPVASTAEANLLIGAGWFGDPADHEERLYSPACRD